ncbi:hypothetical protein H4582DRAFT_2093903 [Lactarius indigo]|nr:hypothetical protein H4582DRAFT_2093903 [Lactarius indigo]
MPIGKMSTQHEEKNDARGSFPISRLQSSLCVASASLQADEGSEVDEPARSSHPELPTDDGDGDDDREDKDQKDEDGGMDLDAEIEDMDDNLATSMRWAMSTRGSRCVGVSLNRPTYPPLEKHLRQTLSLALTAIDPNKLGESETGFDTAPHVEPHQVTWYFVEVGPVVGPFLGPPLAFTPDGVPPKYPSEAQAEMGKSVQPRSSEINSLTAVFSKAWSPML